MIYAADFETVNKLEDCRVWSWGVCNVDENPSVYEWGIDLDGFMQWVELQHKPTIYFHNAKFDTSFIIPWLFTNGFTWTADSKHMRDKTFTTLMSDKGQLYQIKICFKAGKKGNNATILDSFKLIPSKIEQMPKTFGFADEMVKGEIDYNKERPLGYVPDAQEREYQRRDCFILGKSLFYMFQHGMKKMTVGGCSLDAYKQMIGNRNFQNWFPELECDSYIRESYRGGFTYCDPRVASKCVKHGMVFDVNSLYPSVLHDCLLPYGEPIFYSGEYEYDPKYPLYVARCIIDIKLKPDHIPCLQIKKSYLYGSNEYITETKEPAEVYLTSVDIKLIFEQYDVLEFIPLDGYKFMGSTQLFRGFVDYYMEMKINAEKEGNPVMRQIAKLIQNNLYGKFGTNPNGRSKRPIMQEDGKVGWELLPPENRKPVYIPVATFVTSYARYKTITSAQKLYGRFCYADTDSLHITGHDVPDNIEVDQYKLGAWKKESVFRRAKFIRQKTYVEDIFDHKKRRWQLHITCAGMPERCYKHVRWTNFKQGCSFDGHLSRKTAVGGTVLLENQFTIK